MATTYITRRCGRCGYSVTKSIYGYVNDPFGVPFVRCPKCGAISKDKMHKEWIMMSPVKKFFAIFPRGFAYAIFAAIGLVCLLLALFRNAIFSFFESIPNGLSSVIIISAMLIFVAVFLYIFTLIAVNKDDFYYNYLESIRRTRNEAYYNLLSNHFKIYDEKLPFAIRFSSYRQSLVEYNLDEIKEKKEIFIPSLEDSITNA